LLGEVDVTTTSNVDTHGENPSYDKIPQMISSFTTGLSRLDYYLKRAKNIPQYQFAFELANQLMKTANTVAKVQAVWKTISSAYSGRFVKE